MAPPSKGRIRRSWRPTASRSAARARAFIAPIRHPNASCCDRRSPTEGRAPGGPWQSRTAGPRDARGDHRTHVPGAAHRSHPNRDHWVPWSDRAASARFGGSRSRLATAPGWHAGSGSPEACDFRAADVAAGRQGATGAIIPSRACRDTRSRPGCSSQHWPRRQRHLCQSERRCRYRSGNAPLDDFMHARTGKSAFAYRAVRMLQGVPITFPGTTGASRPTPGERRGSTLDRRSDVTGRLRRRCCRGHP